MGEIFDEIRESIYGDMEFGRYKIEIVDDREDSITVRQTSTNGEMEYVFTNPDVINEQWIMDRISMTESAKNHIYDIDTEGTAAWINRFIDPAMLASIDSIIFIGSPSEELETCDLNDDLVDMIQENFNGLTDSTGMTVGCDMIFINTQGVVQKVINDMDNDIKNPSVFIDAVNRELAVTVAHEFMHVAQHNPYFPFGRLDDEYLCGNEEWEAEDFGQKTGAEENPNMLRNDEQTRKAVWDMTVENYSLHGQHGTPTYESDSPDRSYSVYDHDEYEL